MSLDEGRLAVLVARALGPALALRDARIRDLETRMAVVRDGRDGLPGVPGPPGEKGASGLDGKAGQDATLDNIKLVSTDDPRRPVFCFKDGTPIEGGELYFALPLFKTNPQKQFVLAFDRETVYEPMDCVQADGLWIAMKDIPAGGPRPGAGSTDWKLLLKSGYEGKAGREGKPGRDGKDGAPGRPAVHPITGSQSW